MVMGNGSRTHLHQLEIYVRETNKITLKYLGGSNMYINIHIIYICIYVYVHMIKENYSPFIKLRGQRVDQPYRGKWLIQYYT